MNRPNLDEFLREARQEFAFLVGEFGCQEEALPIRGNAYAVRFVNATTRVVVEGINWGLSTRVAIGTASAKFENFDLGDLSALRCGELADKPSSDQRSQMRHWARVLRDCAAAALVLRGDFSIFDELQAVRDRRAAAFGKEPSRG
jgi:hypothetical protein